MASLRLKAAGKTDVGLVRPQNEDFLHIDEANHTYAVCDGMGGHQAGEIASMIASETIRAAFEHFRQEIASDETLGLDLDYPKTGGLLIRSIRLANRNIHGLAEEDAARAGMGTTIVAATLEGDVMTIAHVGDSRAYRLDESRLSPLTTDHSWASEMQQAHDLSSVEVDTLVGRHIITRALGVRPTVEIDSRLIKLNPGDRFLLCSDGLCGFADDDEIHRVATGAGSDINRMVDRLMQLALDRGAPDNITVLIIEVMGVGSTGFADTETQTVPGESEETLRAEDAWVQRIRETKPEPGRTASGSQTGSHGGRTPFFLLLLTLAAVATVIVYVSIRT